VAISGRRKPNPQKNIPPRTPAAIPSSGAIARHLDIALALPPGLRREMNPMANPRSRFPYILPSLGMLVPIVVLIYLAKML
jgi:hypothetical protein